ncbi:hypothetical protein M422DRAFT_272796 [Sphaerobolus stellatus SS14]|uniref:Uncharacterized protein n=1 Tax=Sphaerobolus stellatus (strain SS14) TaxID=990650 RepID=A0A0C9TWF4_SPHS4|nr:hypothetical protein M422DRAFT_272796 [Sphaerobolus stellatus SS14]
MIILGEPCLNFTRDLGVALSYRSHTSPRAWALGLHRTRTQSSAGHHTANRVNMVYTHILTVHDPYFESYLAIPHSFGHLLEESSLSVSSVVNCCLGKAPTCAPSRFMMLDSPSSSVMEGVIVGPRHFKESIEGPSSSSSKVKAEAEDVLVFCPKCYRYHPFEHTCFPKNFSPEL